MTPEDEQDLRDLQSELVAAKSSPWQPRCVARSFGSATESFVLTMQAWIDLDACQSPFLLGRLPEEGEAILLQFEAAFRAFGHPGTTPDACDGDELVLLGWKMVRAIVLAFAMSVKLEPPQGQKMEHHDNGLGEWIAILACLKSQLGFSMTEALALPVGQAFALIAAHRCNEGCIVAGETYEMRDIAETEVA